MVDHEAVDVVPFGSHDLDEEHAAVDDEGIDDEELRGEGSVVNVGIGDDDGEEECEGDAVDEGCADVLVADDALELKFDVFAYFTVAVEEAELRDGAQLTLAGLHGLDGGVPVLHGPVHEEEQGNERNNGEPRKRLPGGEGLADGCIAEDHVLEIAHDPRQEECAVEQQRSDPPEHGAGNHGPPKHVVQAVGGDEALEAEQEADSAAEAVAEEHADDGVRHGDEHPQQVVG